MNVFGIHDFGLFLAAGILLNLTPGPDTAYILGRSIAQGREAGIASALGICVDSIFHTCAAALGLSAILATSAVAFGAIKLLGGAYLVFLGVKILLDRRRGLGLPSNFRRRTTTAAFRQGFLTNVAESESGSVLSGFSTAIHRPGIQREAAGLSHARSHVCDHRYNLVPPTRLVRIRFQRTIARKSDDYSLAQSRCRRTFCFSGSAPRNHQVTTLSDNPALVCAQFIAVKRLFIFEQW